MFKTTLTIGLFDKDTGLQEVSTQKAIRRISETVLNAGIFGATMWECQGIYKMQSNGLIIREPSIRIEFVEDLERDISGIVAELKTALNQESIMVERCKADVSFQ